MSLNEKPEIPPDFVPQIKLENPSQDWTPLSEILSVLPKATALHSWQKKNPRWYEDSQDAFHMAIEVRNHALLIAQGKSAGTIPEDGRVVQYVASFYSWATEHRPTLLAADIPIQSRAYKFRSSLDILYIRDKKVWLTTITTAKKVGIKHKAKLAAQRFAIAEMITRGVKDEWKLQFPEKLSILQLKPGPDAGNYEEIETDGDFETFERAYNSNS